MTVTKGLLDRIRERAFELWEGEGKPDGRHDEHWRQASAEIDTPPELTPATAIATNPSEAADMPAPKAAAKSRLNAKTTPPRSGTTRRKSKGRKSTAPDA